MSPASSAAQATKQDTLGDPRWTPNPAIALKHSLRWWGFFDCDFGTAVDTFNTITLYTDTICETPASRGRWTGWVEVVIIFSLVRGLWAFSLLPNWRSCHRAGSRRMFSDILTWELYWRSYVLMYSSTRSGFFSGRSFSIKPRWKAFPSWHKDTLSAIPFPSLIVHKSIGV